ncbi:hypothetical protein [Nisaea nitritireducens]|uniref:hypothetical protein n=1 Tax=Nisaea nitritireducens TaxID=568392 RepID=UPI00186927DA|nr:hypothetical protein [Nisaea nitritireducens]
MDIYIVETATGYLQELYDKGHEASTLHSMVCSAICEENGSLDEDEVHMMVAEMTDDAERH